MPTRPAHGTTALNRRGLGPASATPPVSGQDILERNFGLSPAQARLTMLLMTGQSVKDIAATLGIADDNDASDSIG